MISEKMKKAINDQINYELYSAYTYFAMEAYFRDVNLDGMATWMNMQAIEELTHAQKFTAYMFDQGARVLPTEIAKPDQDWETPQAVFEAGLAHEREVTKRIYNLVALSLEEKDFATHTFLQWFVTEQVEEEANFDSIIQKFKLISKTDNGLYLLDQELGQRTSEE